MTTKTPRVGSTAAVFLIFLASNVTYAAQNTTASETDIKEIQEKFSKYSLPYGVLGAISHLMTYWVIACHYYGRQPLRPWKNLEKKALDMAIVGISSLVSIIIAIVTLSRVQETKPLVVLAALQVVLSVVMDALEIHRFFSKREGLIRGTILWGVILYGVSYASIYALGEIMRMKKLKGGMNALAWALVVVVAVSGLLALIALVAWIKGGCRADCTRLHVLAISGLICSLAYFLCGDYAVAAATNNTMGMPDKGVAALY